MTETFDAIVVGLGAMGSAATYHLARRGQRVLGLEMFRPGHDQGSSHGEHRMIRKSSFRIDGYVPLAERAFELWQELETEAGQQLLHWTGEVWLVHDAEHSPYRAGIEDSIARGFRVALDERDLGERFPGFRLHEGMVALYEAIAGFLRCEAGIINHVDQARRHGAAIQLEEEVLGWRVDGSGVRVETNRGAYRADRLILTTGPWSAELLADLRLPMRVERRVNGFFRPSRPDVWSLEHGRRTSCSRCRRASTVCRPWATSESRLVSVPGNRPLRARSGARSTMVRSRLRGVLDRYLPGASGPVQRHMTCMCTYTVDGDFIIDRHPDHEQVVMACGFSGRG